MKIALTLISIAIVVGPLVGVLLVYRDNLMGLVLPPEIKDLSSNSNKDSSSVSKFLNISVLQLPTLAGQPYYNQQTGAFSYPINFTNPLSTEISVDQISAEIKSKNSNIILGNISITQPIKIAPGANGIINATGILDPATVNQLKDQYSGNMERIQLVWSWSVLRHSSLSTSHRRTD